MVRVVLADDSSMVRNIVGGALNASKHLEVVALAQNGKEAIECVKKHNPDILILDCEMPVMNGLEALRVIMKECPLPVFMFSSLTAEGSSVTIKALEYGAVDFFLKPTGGEKSLEDVISELTRKVQFTVLKSKFKKFGKTTSSEKQEDKRPLKERLQRKKIDLITMGSSTGGVQAVLNVVPKLPASMLPIVWVQHMPGTFTKSFAARLDGLSKMRVKEVEDGDLVEQGTCYLAPGGFQMHLEKGAKGLYLKIGNSEKVSGHCPSCNVLFESVSKIYKESVLGVILTGMGDDGATGLKKLHDQGAYVLGQNENSCVVYGMPKSAYQLGAVDIELDINEIPEAIQFVTGRNS